MQNDGNYWNSLQTTRTCDTKLYRYLPYELETS